MGAVLSRVFVAPGSTLIVDVPTTYSTLQAAIDGMSGWTFGARSTVAIDVAGHHTLSSSTEVGKFQHPNGANLLLLGTSGDVLSKSISSCTSVSGAAGAYSVTYAVDTTTGVTVGDMAVIRDVVPGAKTPGLITTFAPAGAIQIGSVQMGEATTSGARVTLLNGTTKTSYLRLNTQVFIHGYQRKITALPANQAITVDTAADTVTATAHGMTEGQLTNLTFTTVPTLSSGTYTSGTNVYVRNPTANTFQVSLTVDGTVLNFTSTGSGGTLKPLHFDVDSAFGADTVQGVEGEDGDTILGQQYWYYAEPATGTISASGTTITGLSSLLTTEANVGDLIAFGGRFLTLTSITSATVAEVNETVTGTVSGAYYTIITNGELHEGCWPITAVDTGTNRITVTNTGRKIAPPVNRISGGTLSVLINSVTQTGTGHGIVVDGCNLVLANIALKGPTSGSTGYGIDLASSITSRSPGSVRVTGTFGIYGFQYSARVGPGAVLGGTGGMFSGGSSRGVSAEDGGVAYLPSGIFSGNNGIGLFSGLGSVARASGGRAVNNGNAGFRGEGGVLYGDFAYAIQNNSANLYAVAATVYMVGLKAWGGLRVNCDITQSSRGRLSGLFCHGGATNGLRVASSAMEANYFWVSGNSGDGVIALRGDLTCYDAHAIGNGSSGLRASVQSRVFCDRTLTRYNEFYGTRSDRRSQLIQDAGISDGNGSADHYAADGGESTITSPVGTPTYFPTLNSEQSNRTLIHDGSTAVTRISQSIAVNTGAAATLDFTSRVNRTVIILVWTTNSQTVYGQFRVRLGTGANAQLIAGGSAVEAGTSQVYTGTTGTNLKLTVAGHTDNLLYIENRTGTNFTIRYAIIGDS